MIFFQIVLSKILQFCFFQNVAIFIPNISIFSILEFFVPKFPFRFRYIYIRFLEFRKFFVNFENFLSWLFQNSFSFSNFRSFLIHIFSIFILSIVILFYFLDFFPNFLHFLLRIYWKLILFFCTCTGYVLKMERKISNKDIASRIIWKTIKTNWWIPFDVKTSIHTFANKS